MTKIRLYANCMLVVVLAAVLSTPGSAGTGTDSDRERPLRLYATAMPGPIGSVTSLVSVRINGRIVSGQQSLWGGELIEVSAGESARVDFDSVGRIALSNDTAVRVATTPSSYQENRVLIASLLRGDISVSLEQHASAFVEAHGKRFSAPGGSSFRIGVRTGTALLSRTSGPITVEQASQANYKIRPVDELGRPVDLGRTLSVRARSTRQFQIQVTDENDRPVPDLPLLFSLSDPCLGSLGLGAAAGTSFKKDTDRRGIAAVPFVVGAVRCLGSISANVEGTNVTLTQQVEVTPRASFWSTRNSLLVSAAAAGAILGTTLAVTAGDDGEGIRPVPPPRVTP